MDGYIFDYNDKPDNASKKCLSKKNANESFKHSLQVEDTSLVRQNEKNNICSEKEKNKSAAWVSSKEKCFTNRSGIVNKWFKKYAYFLMRFPCLMYLVVFIGVVIFIYFCNILNQLDGTHSHKIKNNKTYARMYKHNYTLKFKTLNTVLNKSNTPIGLNRKHFYEYFKKDKTASLLFYTDVENRNTKFLQERVLKDIFMLIQYFQRLEISDGKNWSNICRVFSLPMIERSCLVGGLFNTHYINFVSNLPEEMISNKPGEVFQKIMEHCDHDVNKFFKNEVEYLPNIFYYPHIFDKYKNNMPLGSVLDTQQVNEKEIIRIRATNLMENVEALLFAFTFDNDTSDDVLREWYKRMNLEVKMFNEKQKNQFFIKNKHDNVKNLYKLDRNRSWNMVSFNDQTIEENEIEKMKEGISLSLFINILYFLVLCLFILCTFKYVKFIKKVHCVLALMFLNIFATSLSYLYYIIFDRIYLRIYITNSYAISTVIIFIYLIHRFYYQKCKEECKYFISSFPQFEQKEISSTMGLGIWQLDENDCFQEFYVNASARSIQFVYKMLFGLLVFCIIGMTSRHDIISGLCEELVVSLCSLFIFYTFYFSNVFFSIHYKNNKEFDNIKKLYWKNDLQMKKNEADTNKVNENNTNQVNNKHDNFFLSKIQNTKINVSKLDMIQGSETIVIGNKDIKTKKNNSCKQKNGKRMFVMKCILVLLGMVFFCAAHLCVICVAFQSIYTPKINIYKYMSKNFSQYKFLNVLEKKAGYVAEPLYLVLPSGEKFNYALKDNRYKIISLINELKKSQLVHEPIYSWIDMYELYKNDCDTIKLYVEKYDLQKYKKNCKNYPNMDDNTYVSELQETFCLTKTPCNSFNDMIYQWTVYGGSEEELSDVRPFRIPYKDVSKNINEAFPIFHPKPPFLFVENGHINITEDRVLKDTRISFMFHNYIIDSTKTVNNIIKLQNILQKHNIEGAYFYSETFALYNQAVTFPFEFIREYFFNLIFVFVLVMLFRKWSILFFFCFWLCSYVTLLFSIYWFSLNTDKMFWVFLKTISLMKAAHYMYSTLHFEDMVTKKKEFSSILEESIPAFLFIVLYIFYYNGSNYVSILISLMIVNHIVWYILSYVGLFFVYKCAYKKDAK